MHRTTSPVTVRPRRWTLADGRDLLFFDLPAHHTTPLPDRRPLPPHTGVQPQMRLDRTTGEWVIVAAQRQQRTHLPPPDQCPLCPGPSGLSSEIPADDYDVVVFENRFASLTGAGDAPWCPPSLAGSGFIDAAGHGRCEVVCFSSDHGGSFAALDHRQARLVVEAWRHRTADLMTRPGIEQVFCFENRGEEIGVTLSHPHGQIYGYPSLTPRTEAMMRAAAAHRASHGTNLFTDLLEHEVADGSRIIDRTETFTVFVPFAARWPVEVHIYPNRFVRNLLELDEEELGAFTRIYQQTLQRLDRMYGEPLPYMSGLHQYTADDRQQEGRFHVQVISTRRSATKLKYLASSESIMGAYINDVAPEALALTLREV